MPKLFVTQLKCQRSLCDQTYVTSLCYRASDCAWAMFSESLNHHRRPFAVDSSVYVVLMAGRPLCWGLQTAAALAGHPWTLRCTSEWRWLVFNGPDVVECSTSDSFNMYLTAMNQTYRTARVPCFLTISTLSRLCGGTHCELHNPASISHFCSVLVFFVFHACSFFFSLNNTN
jgi:hypothetical protein